MEIIEADRADDPAAHPTILERVEGKVLAVDLSLWIFHAVSQPELADLFPPEGQVAKVVFERALNWLRHGCVPIGVLDGVPPPEKLATMRLRHPGAVGAGGGEFRRLGDVAVSVLRAMGLPTFEAPGEAEATCAALNAAGAVDGCATSDGDAMLFGATNQFKQLKLSAEQPGSSRVERCDAAWVAETLGVDGDVPGALVALALLAGGDYDPGGADRVGSTLAMRVVKGLHVLTARAGGSPGAGTGAISPEPGPDPGSGTGTISPEAFPNASTRSSPSRTTPSSTRWISARGARGVNTTAEARRGRRRAAGDARRAGRTSGASRGTARASVRSTRARTSGG